MLSSPACVARSAAHGKGIQFGARKRDEQLSALAAWIPFPNGALMRAVRRE
jgi:hypothetical protein